jgi:hypothetical protein
MYCDPSMAVAGKRPVVRSENIALSRRSDGGRMQVYRTVVGSSWSSYWSSDSIPTGAGGPGEVSSDVLLCAVREAGTGPCAGGRLACDRVVARTSYAENDGAGELGEEERLRLLLTGVFGLVYRIPDLDAVMCPSVVPAEDLRGEGRVVTEPYLG